MTRRILPKAARATAAAALIAGAAAAAPAGINYAHAKVAPAGINYAHANSSGSTVNPNLTDPRFGIDQVTDSFGSITSADMERLADQMGARWTRIPFVWKYIQPNAPSSSALQMPTIQSGSLPSPAQWPAGWNPFALGSGGSDAAINTELTHGRDIVGLLLGTPAWACGDAQKAAQKSCATGDVPTLYDGQGKPLAWNDPRNAWGTYCYEMARHFGPDTAHPNGRINEWIIWNEVSIPGGTSWTQWNDSPASKSEKDYARLVEVASEAIHAANPTAKVVLYGDPYWYDQGAFLKGVLNDLQADDPHGTYHGYFDAANLHLYIGTPSFYWIITNLRDQLKRHGWGDKQIWVSETNVEPYNDTNPGADAVRDGTTAFRVTQEEQAGFLVDAFATYIAARANRFAIFRMLDGNGMKAGQAPLGVVDNTGFERPFGYSFQFLASLFKNAYPDPKDSYHAGEFYADRTVDGRPVYKAGVFKVVVDRPAEDGRPAERVTTLWNQFGPLNPAVEKTYTKVTYSWDHSKHFNYNPTDGLYHDAKDMIVLPTVDKNGKPKADWAGVYYDVHGTATYTLPTTAKQATIYDKYGHATTVRDGGPAKVIDSLDWNGRPLSYVTPATQMTIKLSHGKYTVKLRGGTTYSNPADPRIPTVGGDPVIIVEQLGHTKS